MQHKCKCNECGKEIGYTGMSDWWLGKSIEKLNMGSKATTIIKKMGINTIQEFIDVPLENIAAIKGVGMRMYDEIKELKELFELKRGPIKSYHYYELRSELDAAKGVKRNRMIDIQKRINKAKEILQQASALIEHEG